MTTSNEHSLSESGGVSELLSAYLDDELTTAERADVENALIDDGSLQRELSELTRTRSLVRDLPLLEVPDDLAARLVARSPFGPLAKPRRRTRTRALAVSALASVAFWGLLASSGGAAVITPDLAGVVSAHLSTMEEEVHPDADPSVMFTAPGSLREYKLVYASRRGHMAHAMYTDGSTEISVFEQPGRVDWDRLPPTGQRLVSEYGTQWTGTVEGQHVMMMERGGMVYVLVASVDAELDEMSTVMPGDDEGWIDQLRHVSNRTLDFFGFAS